MKARSVRILVISAAFLAGPRRLLRRRAARCPGAYRPRWRSRSLPSAGLSSSSIRTDSRSAIRTSKGQPFLVFFGFTHCPDVCPTALFEVSQVLRALGPEADRTRALFITVDPERDTPSVMKDYLSSFDPHFSGLTGDPAAIAAVAKAYRVYYKKVPLEQGDYTMDHTAIVYLMDKSALRGAVQPQAPRGSRGCRSAPVPVSSLQAGRMSKRARDWLRIPPPLAGRVAAEGGRVGVSVPAHVCEMLQPHPVSLRSTTLPQSKSDIFDLDRL